MNPKDRAAARHALQVAAPATNVGAWAAAETAMGTFHVATLHDAVVQTGLPSQSREKFLHDLENRFPATHFVPNEHDPVVARTRKQLDEYARGKRTEFDIPVRAEGTAFQEKVWHALARIPFGEVRSYGEIAEAIGRPGASRAVGQANHNNPVAPIIPCHRVVASDGGLGGYGGGLDLKRRMLEMEGVQIA